MTVFGCKSTWKRPRNSTGGYTLIALAVVISLIGLMALFAVPRFRYSILTDDLKSSTRKIIGLVKNLRNEAVRTQNPHYLHLDLETNRFWADSTAMTQEERMLARVEAADLPKGVRLLDVWLKGKGKKTDGTAYILFTRKGYVPQSAIHLGSEDGRRFTLILSPFLQKVKVVDDYIDFEDA